MAWTTPKTWAAGELLTASDMNTYLRDELNYLASGRPYNASSFTAGASTTSTSYSDTGLSVTLTPAASTRVLIIVSLFAVKNTAGSGFLRVLRDGATQIGNATQVDYNGGSATAIWVPCTFIFVDTGLSLAAHTYALQFKSSDANSFQVAAGGSTRECTMLGLEM
jgi:hypothetical protein